MEFFKCIKLDAILFKLSVLFVQFLIHFVAVLSRYLDVVRNEEIPNMGLPYRSGNNIHDKQQWWRSRALMIAEFDIESELFANWVSHSAGEMLPHQVSPFDVNLWGTMASKRTSAKFVRHQAKKALSRSRNAVWAASFFSRRISNSIQAEDYQHKISKD